MHAGIAPRQACSAPPDHSAPAPPQARTKRGLRLPAPALRRCGSPTSAASDAASGTPAAFAVRTRPAPSAHESSQRRTVQSGASGAASAMACVQTTARRSAREGYAARLTRPPDSDTCQRGGEKGRRRGGI